MTDPVRITPFHLAQRFIGVKEVAGHADNPAIKAMLRLDADWPEHDEVPWCSAFVNYIAWLLRLPRSKSLRARSWLWIGVPISLNEAEAGFDVVILKRGKGDQPGPEVVQAAGHIGFFAGWGDPPEADVLVLGGNQRNQVSVDRYPGKRILGIRSIE